jgi:site-specific recombinase XerD
MNYYKSFLGESIVLFLEHRTARGYKSETYRSHLYRFDRFCAENYSANKGLTLEIVYDWLDAENSGTSNYNERCTVIRQFGKYLNAIGEEVYVLPDKVSSSSKANIPYMFTDFEMSALFNSIDRLPPDKDEPYLNKLAPVLFRLIYTCGLRPNEGHELLRENINFNTGEFLIAHTKMNKSYRCYVRRYAELRQEVRKTTKYIRSW